MSLAGFRADAHQIIHSDGSRVRPTVAIVILLIVAVTGGLYLLPLSEDVDVHVSHGSFGLLMVLVVAVSFVRAMAVTGAHRVAWLLVGVSFVVTGGLFALDPAGPGEDLTVALDAALLPALAFWFAVLALAAPALPGLTSLRAAADVLWVCTALFVAVWPWTMDPLIAVDGRSDLQTLLHLGFVFTTITLATTVLVLLPHTAGRSRIGLWFLGVGGAITSAAGVFHIRFFYEDSLRFGTGWDFLWTVGVAALALAALLTTEGELRHRARGLQWDALMTVVPLALTLPSLLRDHEGRNIHAAAIALLLALAVRVLVLLVENDRLTRALRRDASHDPLTGVGNRRAFRAGVQRIGATVEATGRRRAVALLDLDHFKVINDTHGHQVGDEVLRLVARRLRDAVRSRDVLARHGGDEFVVVMTVRHEREAIRTAERLRRAVAGSYSLREATVEIGATIGVAVDDGTGTTEALLAAADAALYAAKANERGTIELAASAG